MSCYTTLYKKIDFHPEYELMKQRLIQHYTDTLEWWCTQKNIDDFNIRTDANTTVEWETEIISRQIERLKNNYCSYDTLLKHYLSDGIFGYGEKEFRYRYINSKVFCPVYKDSIFKNRGDWPLDTRFYKNDFKKCWDFYLKFNNIVYGLGKSPRKGNVYYTVGNEYELVSGTNKTFDKKAYHKLKRLFKKMSNEDFLGFE